MMRRDKKIWIGILAGIGLLAPLTNAANAISTENNLSKPVVSKLSTAKAVFLVSKPKSLVKVKKNLNVLYKYQDAVTLTDRQLKDIHKKYHSKS
jgi:outer membrane PBP1 activator LpoA protein